MQQMEPPRPFASHRYASHYSQSSLLLMHVVSISSRCLHTSSPLSVSQSPSRAHSLTQLSETANSLPGLCISLTLFAHTLNVVCTQSSSPLSAHQSPSTLPLAASRSQPVPRLCRDEFQGYDVMHAVMRGSDAMQ